MPAHGPTTNHIEIRRWVEAHGGFPAAEFPGRVDGIPLQIGFLFQPPAEEDPKHRIISWDDFFAHFDVHGLSLVYQDDAIWSPADRFEILQIEAKSPYTFNHAGQSN